MHIEAYTCAAKRAQRLLDPAHQWGVLHTKIQAMQEAVVEPHSMAARQHSSTGPRSAQNPSAPRSSGAVWKGVRNTCTMSQAVTEMQRQQRR